MQCSSSLACSYLGFPICCISGTKLLQMSKIIHSYSLSWHSCPSDIFPVVFPPRTACCQLTAPANAQNLCSLLSTASPAPCLSVTVAPAEAAPTQLQEQSVVAAAPLASASCKGLGTLSHFPLTSWSFHSWVLPCLGAASSVSCFASPQHPLCLHPPLLSSPSPATSASSAVLQSPPGLEGLWQPGRCGGSHMLSKLPPWCVLSCCLCRNIHLTLLC